MKGTVRDIANFNGNLVWTRYEAFLVANSIVLGFIGQLVSDGAAESPVVRLVACVFGLLLTALWWWITSAGWSLMHSWLSVMPDDELPPENGYKNWKDKCRVQGNQDPIWWAAHLVIWIFYVAYVLLLFRFANDQPLCVIIALLAACAALFILLLWASMSKFSLSHFEATRENRPPNGT